MNDRARPRGVVLSFCFSTFHLSLVLLLLFVGCSIDAQPLLAQKTDTVVVRMVT